MPILAALLYVVPVHAAASTIHFQGKLTNPDGTNVTDGTYSILFTVYDGGTDTGGGTNVWSETQSTTVSNGIFDVYLGSVNTTLGTAVDFSHNPLYLGVKVGSDPEMSPRILFSSTPYAFNADKLGGIDSNGYAQLSPATQQTGSINISGTITAGGSGNNSFAGTLQSAAYLLGTGPDLSLEPVVGGQSAVTTWWGLQLVGNKQSSVSYTPSNIGTPGQYGVIIPAQQAGAVALLLQAASAQTGDLLQVQSNTGTLLATIDASGKLTENIGLVSNGTSDFNAATNVTGTLTVNTGTADSVAITSGTNVPAADQLTIDNSGSAGVTTNNTNALAINFKGGAAAVESSGLRIDYAPGTTSGGTWSGMRIVAGSNGAVTGVASYGLKLEGPTVAAGGTNTAIKIASGWDIGLDIGSGGLQLSSQADPAPAAAGTLKVYSKTVAGRQMLKVIGPSGRDYPLQPSLFQNQVAIINVQSGTASNYFGTNRSVSGTGVSAAFDENYGYMAGYSSTTTTTTGGIGNNGLQFARGSQVGANGFFANVRGALKDASYPNSRIFVGMTNQTVANSVASQNQTGHRAGFSYDTGRGDTNWMFSTKDGTTENLVDTGMPFSAAAAYDWYIYTPPYPNNGTVYWRIDDMTNGTSQEGSTSSNLPGGSTALRMVEAIRILSGTTQTISYQRIYVESDR